MLSSQTNAIQRKSDPIPSICIGDLENSVKTGKNRQKGKSQKAEFPLCATLKQASKPGSDLPETATESFVHTTTELTP